MYAPSRNNLLTNALAYMVRALYTLVVNATVKPEIRKGECFIKNLEVYRK